MEKDIHGRFRPITPIESPDDCGFILSAILKIRTGPGRVLILYRVRITIGGPITHNGERVLRDRHRRLR